MKKILVSALVLAMGGSCLAQSWVVEKNRKGQAVMDYAYYEQMQYKANKCDSLQAEVERLNGEVKTERNRANQRTPIISFNDSASYAIGRDLHDSWQRQSLGINVDAVIQSLKDCRQGQNTWNEQTMRPLLQKFQQNFEARQRENQAQQKENAKANIEAGKKFLAENAKSKAVYTTKSGLQYRIVTKGNGKRPSLKDRVKVDYTGTLIDGTKFDSSVDRGQPITFNLNQVIPGWTEGIQLMDEGSEYILYLPYNLAYGERDMGNIPAGSTLIFNVRLLEINPKE